jgi:amidohydrolase
MLKKVIHNEILDLMISHRRWFHKNPEIGFDVHNTQKYIINRLMELKFDSIQPVCGTGIKAVLYVSPESQTLAFRADMDALTLREHTGLEYASQNEGIMHACGHDAHMAMLLGFAKWLSDNRKTLNKNIVLIFQPAEESVGGALPMIKEGVLENPKVDAIFGFHLFPGIKQGLIGLREGALMAQTCEFDIEFTGKSAHGAMPQDGADALMAASHFVQSIYAAVSRRLDPMQRFLITIGRMQAGERRNIIAEKALLEGIIRTFDENAYKKVKETLLDFLAGLENTFKVKTRYSETVYYPSVYNDPGLVKTLKSILPNEMLVDAGPFMTAEDFSFFQQNIPGVFMLLGTLNEQKGYCEPLHSNRFDFDEEVMMLGLQVLIRITS